MRKLLLLAFLLCIIFTVAEKIMLPPLPTFTDEMNEFICIEEGLR